MCGFVLGGVSAEGIDLTKETVIVGAVSRSGSPVPGAYVRLLDASGEFTAEVQASETGAFRFFAAPGSWTLRALASDATAERTVSVDRGVTEVALAL